MQDNEIATLLRSHGLKVTRPRTLVYSALLNEGGHHTADDVMTMLTGAGTSLPRASIYNVLDDLTLAGIVLTADRGPGPAVYEVAAEWHHHFVCRQCGAVRDVPCTTGAKPCVDAGVPGVVVDEAQIIFRGLCEVCAGKQQ